MTLVRVTDIDRSVSVTPPSQILSGSGSFTSALTTETAITAALVAASR